MACPAHLSFTTSEMTAAISSSPAPERSNSRRSCSSTANRQFRNMPSAVSRTRSQLPQNASVTLAITPNEPFPSAYCHTAAGELERSTGASGNALPTVATISSRVTTLSLLHERSASRGMNSMNRTSKPLSRPNRAKSTISSSLMPRIITALTFTGFSPAARAASIPSSTRSRSFRRVSSSNRSGRRESREMLIRRSPAAASLSARRPKVAPLVVRARSTFKAASFSTSTGKLARTVGSPPVRRMLSIPRRSTINLAMRSISSKVSRSSRGSQSSPSAGMQYVQRKLHRSVTEMRKSRCTRPKPSISSTPTPPFCLNNSANTW